MTNAIPAATQNTSFNAPRAFVAELHKVAGRNGKSFGEFMRAAVTEAVEKVSPEDAAKLKAELREYYGKVASLTCAILLCGIAFSGEQEIRRPSGGVRVGRNTVRRETV